MSDPAPPEWLSPWLDAARAGNPRGVGRLISWVENADDPDDPAFRALVAALAPSTGRAHVVGLTGPPGVGKSTLTAALTAHLRRLGVTVGVLAVDPSSPLTGGAVLGDRVRMQAHALDPQVHIRSMAARGHLGGLSVTTAQALRVLDLAGCDVTLVETVGVGQSEVAVAEVADTTVVVQAPGLGDGMQAAKAGVLEIADVLVVNKADRDGAPAAVRELRSALALGDRPAGAWRPPVLTTVASTGEGVDRLWEAVGQHRGHGGSDGSWAGRRAARARREIEALALARLRSRVRLTARPGARDADDLTGLADRVAAGDLDVLAAADRVLSRGGP